MNADDNPFPLTPAARLSGSYDVFAAVPEMVMSRFITVETDAFHTIHGHVRDYLEDRPGVPARGRALALVGDFGTGKSHMARELAHMVTTDAAEPLVWLVDEPAWDFGAIYRDRLVSDLKEQKAAFYDVLLDYYSDVTAENLERSRRLGDIAQGLRDRHLDPQAVIDTYALSEATIRGDLERRLQVLTEHRKFAVALTLLQFPEFQNAVWEWLMGHPPGPVLRERGIDAPIDTMSSVFDALAVFAFLYGQAGRRFVFVMDMLERVLDWSDDRCTDFMQAFEKLVNVYVSVGGLLVFCVPPEALNSLGQSLHERILPIRLGPLSRPQAMELVGEYLHPLGAGPGGTAGDAARDVAPFTMRSVEYIRDLTGGVPRRLLKVCHHAWKLAAARDDDPVGVIDDVVVRNAVREAFQTLSRDDIRASIESLLETGPWRYEHSSTRFRRRHGGVAENVDFWLLVGQAGAAIALITTDSLMQEHQIDRLRQIVEAARGDTGPAPCEVLIIVNGYVSPPLRQRLADFTITQPIIYGDRRFAARLRESIDDLVRRLEMTGRDSALDIIRERIEGLCYQQTGMLDHLRRLDGQVEQLGISTGARLGELLDLAAEDDAPLAPGRGRSAAPRLPQEIQRHFDRAFDAVGMMSGVPTTFRQMFDVGDPAVGESGWRPRRLRFTSDQFQAVGVAVLLQKLLEAFRDSVREWVRRSLTPAPEPVPAEAQVRRLRTICRSYEITSEMLPIFRLESLAAFGPFTGDPEPVEQASRSFHRAEAEEALVGLGERVFEATLAAVRSSPPHSS